MTPWLPLSRLFRCLRFLAPLTHLLLVPWLPRTRLCRHLLLRVDIHRCHGVGRTARGSSVPRRRCNVFSIYLLLAFSQQPPPPSGGVNRFDCGLHTSPTRHAVRGQKTPCSGLATGEIQASLAPIRVPLCLEVSARQVQGPFLTSSPPDRTLEVGIQRRVVSILHLHHLAILTCIQPPISGGSLDVTHHISIFQLSIGHPPDRPSLYDSLIRAH